MNNNNFLFILSFLLIFFPNKNSFTESLSSSDAAVYIIEPKNNQNVTNPVKIKFGIQGMSLSPAGINRELSGHHHLLIDVDNFPDLKKPIPSDKNHLHFGKGQTETIINLKQGKHTLQLLLGDYLHIPHKDPVYSQKITIYVEN
jgi:hypothetical protein